MIFDDLRHVHRYASLHPAFTAAFAYLEAFSGETPDGNHAIGLGCEARVMSYRTEAAETRRWESHRRFIDIQYVVAGRELMQVAEVGELKDATPYDDANDVTFYSAASTSASELCVRAGTFAIFFPHDGHRPGIEIDAPADVRKIVIKVPVKTVAATV
jgi:biofilm protein TabA